MMAAVDNPTVAAPSLRQRLGGGLRPRVAGFWTWWTRALAEWVPARARSRLGLVQERLLLQIEGDQLRLLLERDDAGLGEIGRVPLPAVAPDSAGDPLSRLLAQRAAKLPRWLLLPADAGLRRALTLPAAAADRLRAVLGYEIDRQTPFAAADVYYDARIVGRRDDGQIAVELVVVPRARLDALIGAAEAVTNPLAGVDMVGADGRALGVNLLAGSARQQRDDPWRRWNWTLAGVAVLAVAAGLWQILDNRRDAADAFEREVAERVREASAAAAERRRLIDLVEGMQYLQDSRAGRPSTVEIIDELARRLPDSTYLEKLSIEGDRLMLIGLSNEASALVKRLEGSKLWRSPALTGALMPDPRSGRDRFNLAAELVVTRPKGEAAADARRQP